MNEIEQLKSLARRARREQSNVAPGDSGLGAGLANRVMHTLRESDLQRYESSDATSGGWGIVAAGGCAIALLVAVGSVATGTWSSLQNPLNDLTGTSPVLVDR